MEHIIQKDVNDCGIACILMLLEHDFNIKLDYYEVRNLITIEEKGIRLDSIIDYLNKFDNYKAYECDFTNLPSHPFITIINVNKKFNHYIVVWKKDDKYVYYSNPCEEKPMKMIIKQFKKIYQGIIVYFKEKEIEKIETNKKLKIKKIHKYLFPLLFLNILEIILFTLSFMYLFNINEFNIFKIATFFTILTIQIIIYLLKNHFINLINSRMDYYLIESDNLIENKIELKEHIKKSFYLKNKKNIYYNKIIPYLTISIFAYLFFFYINYLLALSMFLLMIIYYLIEKKYYIKRNKYNSKLIQLENEFNESDNIENILDKIKINIKKSSKINNSNTIISLFYRQSILIFIMLFFSLINQSRFVFFGLYLCFYIFDGINAYAEYKSDIKTYKYIIYNFKSNKID